MVPPKLVIGTERIQWIRDEVVDLANLVHPDLVILEAPFISPKMMGSASKLLMLHGAVQVTLYDARIPVVLVPPACLKKYATGKGNADKHAVLAEAIRRLGYAGSDDNEADALWLWAMAHERYGHPVAVMPQVNRSVLEKIEWPTLGRAVECGESSGPF